MIKFNAWLFLINLEIQEESFYISFTLHLLQFLYYLFTLSHHNFTFYIIKPHCLLKVIDKRKKINLPLGKTNAEQRCISSQSLFDKGQGLHQWTQDIVKSSSNRIQFVLSRQDIY